MPTLSIGDGANDLRMIETADIGMLVKFSDEKGDEDQELSQNPLEA